MQYRQGKVSKAGETAQEGSHLDSCELPQHSVARQRSGRLGVVSLTKTGQYLVCEG